MNSVALTGRMTKDPDLHITRNGESVVSFTLAVKRPKIRDMADFVDCVAWDDRADFIGRTFKKGDKVEVTGYLTTRNFDKDGISRKATEVKVEEISYCNDAPGYKKPE